MSPTLEVTRAELRDRFLGVDLQDVSCPAAVIDVSIVKRNCQRMLDACQELGFGFRAHVKTHKVCPTFHIRTRIRDIADVYNSYYSIGSLRPLRLLDFKSVIGIP